MIGGVKAGRPKAASSRCGPPAMEKLESMHWNPVRRGLVETVEAWRWSSGRSYLLGEKGKVQIESDWTMHLEESKSTDIVMW